MAVAHVAVPAARPARVATVRPHPTRVRVPSRRQDEVPIVDALRRYRAASTVSFATPGHKSGAATDPLLRSLLGADILASDVWLNTVDRDTIVAHAEELAAAAWGADRSFFLVNGSSAGNHAFLLAALRPGDEVVVGRDLHQSMLAALVQTGARPIYVAPRLHPTLDVGLGIDPTDVAAALHAHPAAKLVALVSPTYWGVASDLAAIATVAHSRGVPLYVDEAWGPHLPFHRDLPPFIATSHRRRWPAARTAP